VVGAADPLRSLISVSRPEPLLFFQVAPHLSCLNETYVKVRIGKHLSEFRRWRIVLRITGFLDFIQRSEF
jgi:hypothetical protein